MEVFDEYVREDWDDDEKEDDIDEGAEAEQETCFA